MGDLTLALAFSTHLIVQGDFNAIHPMIKYQADNGVVAGAYLNSDYNVSTFVGYRMQADNGLWTEVNAVTGYTYIAPVVPMVRVGYEIEDGPSVFAAPIMSMRESDGKKTIGFAAGLETKMWSF
jgi:hypothetical protein